MRIRAPIALALCLTTSAGAANLLPNPGFDDQDLSSWVPVDLAFVEWSLVDELGVPSSGSMRLFDSNLSRLEVRRCIPVAAGEPYAFGASARIPEFPRIEQAAHTAVHWWSGVNCGGSELAAGAGGATAPVSMGDSWGTVQGWGIAPPGARSASFALLATALIASDLEVLFDNAFFVEDATCVATPSALCLNRSRFLVTAEWESRHFAGGYGRAAALTDDSGYVTFFADENVELVVKLLDACSTSFHRFWFFAAGLTDIATTLRVYDTRGGGVRTYISFLEEPFEPVQDTDAFATCP